MNAASNRTTSAFLLTSLVALASSLPATHAAISVPGADGSDGPLIVAANTEIDLALAATGPWDANNSATPGAGIYDPEKWAVVFKYTEVNISPGARLTFKNHPSRAPVVWLVQGNITISGALDLNGGSRSYATALAEPGPGGFRGGHPDYPPGVLRRGDGFGVGGGGQFVSDGRLYVGSGWRTGNPSLLPLIGGSGGAGAGNVGGGAGGGAILIASVSDILLNGKVEASGGSAHVNTPGYYDGEWAGGGNGGSVRLVANRLLGNGKVEALGGEGIDGIAKGRPGVTGRVRIEAVSRSAQLLVSPDPSVASLTDGEVAQLWLPPDGPTAAILEVGTTRVPPDPRAGFGAVGADVAIPNTSVTPVVVETTHVGPDWKVWIRVTPRANSPYAGVQLFPERVLSQDPLVLHWTNHVPVTYGLSAMQVVATRP